MKESDMRVLVVEDDLPIQEVIQRYLEEHGFRTLLATSGPEALEKAAQGVELVVLDLQLPGLDGLDVVRALRRTSRVPILIVSARADAYDRITGLELGADDYMVKPFVPRELVARVRALLRRSRMPALETLEAGPLVLEPEARRVTMDGDVVDLTPREFEMLRVLFLARGKTFSREELLDRVWGPEYVGETRRVDLCISRLRAKLLRPGAASPIVSVWGVGYRFDAP